VLTAYDWADIEEEAKEAGITAFCNKPLFISDLRRCLLKTLHPEKYDNDESSILQKNFHGKKILLVEDNELNREIATEILDDHGFNVAIAENGSIAVDIISGAREKDIDVILMDIQMPIMDGYEATKMIRGMKNTKLANVPIIAMTANAFEEDKKLAMDVGMNGYIAKPIDIPKLLKIIGDLEL
jgi:CheY-like chemotaxis protein